MCDLPRVNDWAATRRRRARSLRWIIVRILGAEVHPVSRAKNRRFPIDASTGVFTNRVGDRLWDVPAHAVGQRATGVGDGEMSDTRPSLEMFTCHGAMKITSIERMRPNDHACAFGVGGDSTPERIPPGTFEEALTEDATSPSGRAKLGMGWTEGSWE
jgi:hypothetical protein